MKTCCFTGHRRIPESGKKNLFDSVFLHICRLANMGVTDFICGGALGFDTIAAQAVLALRERRPDIRLILYLPCENRPCVGRMPIKLYTRKLRKRRMRFYIFQKGMMRAA